MTRMRFRPSRRSPFRPWIESLEDRYVPQAGPPAWNTFAIASQALHDLAALNRIQHHLAGRARSPSAGQALSGELAELAARNRARVAELQADQAQMKSAAQDKIAALDRLYEQAAGQAIQNRDDRILALARNLATLPPAQRDRAAKQVSEETHRVKDETRRELKRLHDRLAGEERATGLFLDRCGRGYALALGRSEADEAKAKALEQEADSMQGGTAPGAGAQPGDPCTGKSSDLELLTDDPRFDGAISCMQYEALPPDQRPAVR
jgi:hypothetical protein